MKTKEDDDNDDGDDGRGSQLTKRFGPVLFSPALIKIPQHRIRSIFGALRIFPRGDKIFEFIQCLVKIFDLVYRTIISFYK